MADVSVQRNAAGERFETTVDGHHGLLTYGEQEGKLYLLHTEVDEALEGRGVGGALVRAAAGYARERGLRIVPFCPFARTWLQRHHEFDDLVDRGS